MGFVQTHRRARLLTRAERLSKSEGTERVMELFDDDSCRMCGDGLLILHGALASARSGQMVEARDVLAEQARRHPGDFVYPLFLGQVLYDLGDLPEALEAFRAASRLDPGNELIQAYVDLTGLAQGRLEEGHDRLVDRVSRVNAACRSRVLLLCEGYLAKHAEVCLPLEKQVDAEESKARSRGWLGRAGDTIERGVTRAWHAGAKLLAALRPTVDRTTRRARLDFLEGSLRYDLEELDDSWAAFSTSLDREPGRLLTRLRLADLCLRRGDYAGALEWLGEEDEDDAAWRTPLEYLPPYYAGVCQVRLGNGVAARAWFQAAAGRRNPGIVRLRLEEVRRVRGLDSIEQA